MQYFIGTLSLTALLSVAQAERPASDRLARKLASGIRSAPSLRRHLALLSASNNEDLESINELFESLPSYVNDDELAGMVSEFGNQFTDIFNDEDLMQCFDDTRDFMIANPDVERAEIAMMESMDLIANMDPSAGKVTANIEIPNDKVEAYRNACVAADGLFELSTLLDCSFQDPMMGGVSMELNFSNLGVCQIKTDACSKIDVMEFVNQLYAIMGIECEAGDGYTTQNGGNNPNSVTSNSGSLIDASAIESNGEFMTSAGAGLKGGLAYLVGMVAAATVVFGI